jgi:uncharacterized membrane protein SpoIIM required for sporulation
VTRDELVRARGPAWRRLDALVADALKGRGAGRLAPSEIRELSELYRSLAGDLMRVRRDKLGADLERHLHALAARAHNTVYGGSSVGHRYRVRDLFADFPGAVRRNLRFVLLAHLLFYGPFFASGLAASVDESYAVAIVDASQLEGYEKMYAKAPDTGTLPGAAAGTGFYVNNNVGIALRSFATGLLFGLGTIFFTLYNGLMIGVVFGHLHRVGLGHNLLTFTASHSPWELTAIVLAAAAGLQMGFALVRTHGRTRLGHLQAHALELLRQVAGFVVFLLIAAVIEAAISPSPIPPTAKATIGALGWLIVYTTLLGLGRERPPPDDVLALRARSGP